MADEVMSAETRRRRTLILCLLGAVVVAFVSWFFAQHGTDMTSNEVAAVGALRTIASVQKQFREGDREGDGFPDYATSLEELSNVGFLDEHLGSGRKGGYVFSLSGTTYDWNCRATPESEEVDVRNFIVCTDGVVRFSTKEPADCSSEAVE